jgi:hypothetical protein
MRGYLGNAQSLRIKVDRNFRDKHVLDLILHVFFSLSQLSLLFWGECGAYCTLREWVTSFAFSSKKRPLLLSGYKSWRIEASRFELELPASMVPQATVLRL